MEQGDAAATEEAPRPRDSTAPVMAAVERLREELSEVARRISALPDHRSLEARIEALSEGVAALRRSTLTAEEGQRLLARVDNLGNEVAARVGVDAAVAALGVRLGSLGSALDQTRITMLEALSAAAEPDWVVGVRSRIEALLSAAANEPGWASALRTELDDISETVSSEPTWAAGLGARLEAIENRAATTDTAGIELIATAVEQLSKRLDSDLAELTTMLSRSMDILIARVQRIEAEQAQLTAAAQSRAEVAAARLETLRAERQQVSAKLEEERRRYREALQPSEGSASEPGSGDWLPDEDRDLGADR